MPIEDAVGRDPEMIEAGYVRHLGLSRDRRGERHPAGARQSTPFRELQIDVLADSAMKAILPVLRELGIERMSTASCPAVC